MLQSAGAVRQRNGLRAEAAGDESAKMRNRNEKQKRIQSLSNQMGNSLPDVRGLIINIL